MFGRWKRTLGPVDIRCEEEASRSFGENGRRQSLRWNQIEIREDQLERRSHALLFAHPDRTRRFESWLGCKSKQNATRRV